MLTGQGSRNWHTMPGLHCGFSEKKQAKSNKRFRIRQFESCWGLQNSPCLSSTWPWVTRAENKASSKGKPVELQRGASECVLCVGWSDMRCCHRRVCLLLERAVFSYQLGFRCRRHQRCRKGILLWFLGAKKCEVHHHLVLVRQAAASGATEQALRSARPGLQPPGP